MILSFLLLIAASAICRFVSWDAGNAFKARLARMVPRNVMEDHMRVLLEEFPDRLPEFRRRVAPCAAMQVMLDTAACACFAAACWFFPPHGMQHWALALVRYGSVLITPVAFVADVVSFARMFLGTYGRNAEVDGAV
jgi:hypothetical protein